MFKFVPQATTSRLHSKFLQYNLLRAKKPLSAVLKRKWNKKKWSFYFRFYFLFFYFFCLNNSDLCCWCWSHLETKNSASMCETTTHDSGWVSLMLSVRFPSGSSHSMCSFPILPGSTSRSVWQESGWGIFTQQNSFIYWRLTINKA